MNLNFEGSGLRGFNVSLEKRVFTLYVNYERDDQYGRGASGFQFPSVTNLIMTGPVPAFLTPITGHTLQRSGEDWKHSITAGEWSCEFTSPTVSVVSLEW